MEQRRRMRIQEKWGLHAFLPEKLIPIPSVLQSHEDPLSKVIQFHIMKDPTDPQPTIVRREHRIY